MMKTRNLVITAMFTAVQCVLSVVSFPVGAVPVTLSVLGVFLIGSLLSPVAAVSAELVYITIGAIGLPVFSGFSSGLGTLFGPTGGYLMAYPIMAFAVAYAAKRFERHRTAALCMSMAFSLAVCYVLGTAWFCTVTKLTFDHALAVCVAPFVPFDLIKAAAAVAVSTAADHTPLRRLLREV